MYKTLKLIALGVVAVAALPSFAHAYLDPGTGSYVIQVIIGLALGGAYAVKSQWLRIRMLFAKKAPSLENKKK